MGCSLLIATLVSGALSFPTQEVLSSTLRICPPGFFRHRDMCFYLELEKLDYHTAALRCSLKGATMFSPTSSEQWYEVMAFTPISLFTWSGIVMEEDAGEPHFNKDGAIDAKRVNWLVKPFTASAEGWTPVSKCAAFYNAGSPLVSYVYFYPCSLLHNSICQKELV
ncbi:unnamed protein product [Heligmosomoides polygyrus]|uniref:C-type lectin domain-containing protein n=1 Tax=Heligmosomoides polygyrus TaxID=6339 RepID=A0A3P8C7C9_HELPZ|nr:unnamed protein product [Heligmosomoides polygyrus]